MWPIRLAAARLRPFGISTVLRIVFAGGFGGALLYGAWSLFRRLFREAAKIEAATPFFALGLIENLLTLVFLTALFVLFFSALTTSIGALFVEPDLEMYIASPRRRLAIVASRFVRTYVTSTWLVLLFLCPLFVALAQQYEAGMRFLLHSVVVLGIALSVPVSIACIATLLLVRWFPVRRVHQIVATLAVIALTLAVVGVRMARPERLFQEVETDDVVAVLEQIDLPEADRTPAGWLASSVVTRAGGDSSLKSDATTTAAAAAAFGLFLLLASRMWYPAWVRGREGEAPAAIGGAAATSLIDRLTTRASPQFRALLGKEVRVVTRDAAQWSQLFLMLALLFIYLYNIQMMPLEGDVRAIFLSWLNIGMAAFVVAAVCLRFAYPSLSAEGKSFWIIESSPVSMRQLLWIKVAVYAAPLLILDLALVIAANLILEAPRNLWLPTLGGSFVITLTLVTFAVGMGALWPDFRKENPMEVALSLGGFAYMSISLLYVGVVMFLFARPAMRFFLRIVFGVDEGATWVTRITPVAAGSALSLILCFVPMELATRRLRSRTSK